MNSQAPTVLVNYANMRPRVCWGQAPVKVQPEGITERVFLRRLFYGAVTLLVAVDVLFTLCK